MQELLISKKAIFQGHQDLILQHLMFFSGPLKGMGFFCSRQPAGTFDYENIYGGGGGGRGGGGVASKPVDKIFRWDQVDFVPLLMIIFLICNVSFVMRNYGTKEISTRQIMP